MTASRQRVLLGLRLGLLAALLVTLLPACALARARSDGEAERVVALLELEAGDSVADVGAGDGEWTVTMARAVGPAGQVFATEVDEEEIAEIRERIAVEGLTNVTVLTGDQQRTGLRPGCCGAILLRLVYHHFRDPQAMQADLERALPAGGLILVVEIEPQRRWGAVEGVPERGGHGIAPDDLVAEMAAGGFEEISRHPDWPGEEDKFAVLFRKPVLRP